MTSQGGEGLPIVQVGSQVRIREANGEGRSLRIRDDANWSPGMLDPQSPLGKALIGRHVGEEVEVHLASSLPTRRVTIEALE